MSILSRLRSPAVRRVLLWILHVLLVIAILVGLYWVNRHWHVDSKLLSALPELHSVWLPLLFLFVYVGAWLAWWFFRLLIDPRDGTYPDIDEAWRVGLQSLDAAGIDITALPVFLIVGRPKGSVDDLFAASGLPLSVRGESNRCVRIFANREAIYVTCEGASALAAMADAIKLRNTKAIADVTSLLDDDALDVPAVESAGVGSIESWLPGLSDNPIAELSADEVRNQSARLTHLGRLIAVDRRPYCGINGILWLIPSTSIVDGEQTRSTIAVTRSDREAISASLQLDCPSVALVCDSEEITGFREMLELLPANATRDRLLGRTFPLVPGIAPEERAGVFQSGIDWVSHQLVPGLVYQLVDPQAPPMEADDLRRWQFADAVFQSRRALAKVLVEGLAFAPNRPPMLGGVFFAGTGTDQTDQAFVAAVFQQLNQSQNAVSWTETALAEEGDYRRMEVIGYAVTILFVAGIAVFGWMTWDR